jgi:hypothetical protein
MIRHTFGTIMISAGFACSPAAGTTDAPPDDTRRTYDGLPGDAVTSFDATSDSLYGDDGSCSPNTASPYCGADHRYHGCGSDDAWHVEATPCPGTQVCDPASSSGTQFFCVDSGLVACNPSTFVTTCSDNAVVYCAASGHTDSEPCRDPNPLCTTGHGTAACAFDGSVSCVPDDTPASCASSDPDYLIKCSPAGETFKELCPLSQNVQCTCGMPTGLFINACIDVGGSICAL